MDIKPSNIYNRQLEITMEESDGRKASITIHADVNIHEMMEEIFRLLVGYGYHPDSVKEGFIAKSEEYMLEEEQNEREKGEGIEEEDI